MKKPNIVSLLVGTILGVTAMLTLAATSSPSIPYGRFQLLAADSYLFKIDTSTGQVWRTYVSSPSKEFMAPNIPMPKEEKKTNAVPENSNQ